MTKPAHAVAFDAKNDPDGELQDARDALNDGLNNYVDEWDDYAGERWGSKSVGNYGPDHVALRDSVERDAEALPEFEDLKDVLREVQSAMLAALRDVEEAESRAATAYARARAKLVKVARTLPDVSKRTHPALFREE
jgi:hypothetical protein